VGGWIARATGILPHLAAGDIHAVAGILRAYWPWTPLASLALLILETVIPPLPAWPVLAANALIYGIWGGIALSWLGGLLGTVVMFCLGRTLGRGALRRWVKPEHQELIDQISREKGFQILLVARLFPLTSLDILSFAAGLSAISFGRFLLATAVGLLPGVALYTFFAHDLIVARAVTGRLALALSAVLLVYAGRRLAAARRPAR